MSSPGTDLRQRYADLVTAWFEPGARLAHLRELLAVRDEELERLQGIIDRHDHGIMPVCEGYMASRAEQAERERDEWRERAEKAERRLAEIRRFVDEDFRFWCSPHGVAGRYARDLIEVIDATEADRG